ncbi:MAG: ABC transporter permease [Sulfolobales archaeon]
MKPYDAVRLAWKQLIQRKLRTVLTVLAVAVGVMVIIALSSHTQGLYVSFIANFEKLGPSTIIVTSTGSRLLSDVDLYRIAEMSEVSNVIPMRSLVGNIEGLSTRVSIVGVRSYELKELLGGSIDLVEGNLFPDTPIPAAVVGYNVAYDPSTGRKLIDVGQVIVVRIGSRSIVLNVLGILNYYGGSVLLTSPDDTIYIPLDYFIRFSGTQGYSMLMVKASDINVVNEVAENIRTLLGTRARITTVQSVINTFTTILNQINLLLVSIASTSFIAAGLGTFNIMMISVLERTREIGLIKALGMKDSEVLLLYLTQGMLIGIIGGLIGFGLGIMLSHTLSYVFSFYMGAGSAGTSPGVARPSNFASYTPIISNYYTLVAILLSMSTTALASIYPSWRAARLNPVEALRYE